MFYDKYVRLCNSVNKSPSAVALELGIAKPTVSRWKNGSKPNHATVLKVADYFNVPVSTLTGEAQKESPPQGGELSSKDIQFVKWFRSLSPEKQRAILIAQDGPVDLAD